MSDIAIVRATFADRAEAERVAEAVVADRLAACANVEAACRSIYRWNGKVERGEETPALFKTAMPLARPLAARIASLHSYDLPAIEIWPASVSDELAAWVTDQTES